MIASRIIFLALLSGLVNALPHRVRDSSTNEPAVSAPNGSPITEGTQPAETPVDNSSSDSWGGSSMGYGGSNMGSSGDMGSMSSMDESWGGSSMGWSASMDSTATMDSTAAMSTMDSMFTSTSTAWSSKQTPTYGSGSSNWGSSSSGYDNCVSQCMAQYGSPPQAWTPPAQTTPDNGSKGSGAEHTVIVAPAQGVLRYVPFMMNVSRGDTIKFVWGADTHTVTKSSELTPCNKTSTAPFTSGTQLAGATFTQVVNDTDPLFVYCGVPGHCQKGMFAIFNPPSLANAPTSVSMMMPNWTASNADLSAYATITNNMTQNNVAAGNWGDHLDTKSIPSWAHQSLAENIIYNRRFLAMNPDVMREDGTIDLSNAEKTPLMFPQDVSQGLSNAGADGDATSSSSIEAAPAATTEATSAASAETPSANASNINGAMTTSPKFTVALAAAAAASLLLL